MPEEDFHLSDRAPSRAHERRHLAGIQAQSCGLRLQSARRWRSDRELIITPAERSDPDNHS